MIVSEVCTPDVVWAPSDLPVRDAARLMREEHAGCVVVAEVKQGQPHPTGIVTDRDIVISVLAAGLDPNVFTLGDIATPGLVVAREGEGVFTAVRRMRAKGVRRLPVVDEAGVLKGIFTLDDYIGLLADEVREAASIIDREQTKEVRTRVAIPG